MCGDCGVVGGGVGPLVVALVYVTRYAILRLHGAWLVPSFPMKERVPLLPSSRCYSPFPSSSGFLSLPGPNSPRKVPQRLSSATWVPRAVVSSLESSVSWPRGLNVVASVSVERFRAAASTLESSAAPPVSGALALAWLALFVAAVLVQ